jgi:DNA-binding transcriptional MerR regulator
MANFSIGMLSKKTGCNVTTIRYYEQAGLLPEPYRTEGNQRRYQNMHLSTLQFILHARQLGFTLDDIRELMTLSRSSVEEGHKADEIASKHLKEIELKVTRLVALKNELKTMLKACEHGQADSCRVIEVLSDHTLCSSDHNSNIDKG